MKEYHFDSLHLIETTPVHSLEAGSYSEERALRAMAFHRSIPGYKETPLVSLSCAADQFHVDSLFVKDESHRFGLKAFKGLGGSYCLFRVLCERFGLNQEEADYQTFQQEDLRAECRKIHVATATDGNHGKGVSWAAGLFGCRAHVFMPAGSVEARRKAIEDAGNAEAIVTEMNYDDTVRYTAALAEKNGWILMQDTSFEGYETYPRWIMEGYLTMAREAAAQMKGKAPTHLFLQAGVGSMAGCIEAYFQNTAPGEPPLVTIVEPTEAACVYQSVLAGDGKAHTVPGNPKTIMAGLNCGTPCSIIWPVLRDCSSLFCRCDDSITEKGMQVYAHPLGTDPRIVSGESGAVTYGLLRTVLENRELRDLFRIDENSVILLFNTEGDTNPEGYRHIITQ